MVAFALLGAQTTANGTGSSWVTAPAIIAAAITAAFTLAGILVKDILLKRLEEGRSDRKAEVAIYERYAHPLVTSAISLLHRLNEILFEEHRPIYLRKRRSISVKIEPGRSYLSYKRLSTAYRVAAVLGWMRACRREFSYLRIAEPLEARRVDTAIGSFEMALADGGWVEQERVLRLCDLWQLGNSPSLKSPDCTRQLGIKVNNLFWDVLEESKHEKENATELPEETKLLLCRRTADCITSHLNTNTASDPTLNRTWPDAFSIITMREAWIYRDWQSAIGDVMTRASQMGGRNFEVIGYGDFEQFLSGGTEQQQLAIDRLLAIIDALDLSIQDRFDCRPRQLRSVAKATAEMILAIHKTQNQRSIVPLFAVGLAERVIEKLTISIAKPDKTN